MLYFAVSITLFVLFLPLLLSNLWRMMTPLVVAAAGVKKSAYEANIEDSAKPLLLPSERAGPGHETAWALGYVESARARAWRRCCALIAAFGMLYPLCLVLAMVLPVP